MMKKLMFGIGAAALVAMSAPAFAAPINAPGTFVPSAPIVTFDSFDNGTSGPLTVGPLTIDSAPTQAVGTRGYTQFPDIYEGKSFGFTDATFTLSFSEDVMAVGFGLFDPNYLGTKIEAFDRFDNLLEAIAPPPLGPTGGVFSTYVGFSRAVADIATIIVTPQAGDLLAIDNIAWKTGDVSEVPLPATLWLMVAGLGGLGMVRRYKKT